jgi:hypothetical protein
MIARYKTFSILLLRLFLRSGSLKNTFYSIKFETFYPIESFSSTKVFMLDFPVYKLIYFSSNEVFYNFCFTIFIYSIFSYFFIYSIFSYFFINFSDYSFYKNSSRNVALLKFYDKLNNASLLLFYSDDFNEP